MIARDSLELNPNEFRRLVDAATARICDLLLQLPDLPVDNAPSADPDFVKSLKEPLPNSPTDLEELLDTVFTASTATGFDPTSPGFMGYVPGGGILHAAVADLMADSINHYVAVSGVAPVFNQLEANVVRWFAEIVGFPQESRGFLTSGGSMATLGAITTARHVKLGDYFSDGLIYVSDQVHHCVTKAARLAGFPEQSLRVLPSDSEFRLAPDVVDKAVASDSAAGRRPFMVVASAGTTNTGAVDQLADLAQIARDHGLWFHVDGAYGGLFRLTDRGKTALRGIEDADSVVIDPHKTLFLPYGTGCLLVRDGRHLRATYQSSAEYLPILQDEDSDIWDFCDISPELTRPFRGLRVWLPMKLLGANVFRKCLEEKLDLAAWTEKEIQRIPELDVLARAELSILAFAVVSNRSDIEEQNRLTRLLLELVNKKNRVHLTGTMLHDVFAIRVAIVSFRTHRDHAEMLIEDVKEGLAELVTIPAQRP